MRNAGSSKVVPSSRRWLYMLCIATSALTGCSALHTTGGTGALLKADQRAIVVTERTDSDRSGSGKRYVACAEPSPDAMSTYAAQFAADLSKTTPDGGKMSAEAKAALQQAAAFIGMRTPSIQLLRDAMYRVCEAYANGAINPGQYELLMRRYQRQIVAMMAIEQLTQAGQVPHITLTSEGQVGGGRFLSDWNVAIDEQQDIVNEKKAAADDAAGQSKAAASEVKASQEIIDTQTKVEAQADAALREIADQLAAGKLALAEADTQKAAAEQQKQNARQKKEDAEKQKTEAVAREAKAKVAKKAADAEVDKAQERIDRMYDQMAGGGTSLEGRTVAGVVASSRNTQPKVIEAVAPAVERLATRVLNVDDTGALCFEYHTRADRSQLDPMVKALCEAFMEKGVAEYKWITQRLNECMQRPSAREADACMDGRHPTPGSHTGIKGTPGGSAVSATGIRNKKQRTAPATTEAANPSTSPPSQQPSSSVRPPPSDSCIPQCGGALIQEEQHESM